MTSGFFSRLVELGEVMPDDEAAPSLFSTALFGLGSSVGQTDAGVRGSISSGPNVAGHALNAAVGGAVSGASPPGSDSAEVTELRQRVSDLTRKLDERSQEYKELLEEAAAVRAESDAYRRKSEAQRRQERQQAQENARMLDELRRAGGSGRVEEVYVEGLQRQAAELERQLRDAMAETQTAVRRQREAEEQRKLLEREKRDEVAELVQRYNQLLERARDRQQQLEAQLAAERARRVGTVTDEETAEEAREGSGEALAARTATPTASAGSSPAGAAVEGAPAAGEEAAPAEMAAVQRQLVQLRARVRDLEREAAAAEERARRQLDESAADAMEAQRRLADKTTELDRARAQLAELQSASATREDEHRAREKELLFQVRELEDAATKWRRKLEETELAMASAAQAHAEALQQARERAALTVARADEAESASKAVATTLEAQRAHFESLLQTRDTTIAELSAVRRALEQAVQDGREDARRQADVVEQLRHELADQLAALRDTEARQLHSQRLLLLREEELQSREAERQRLRALLREEEDAHTAARQSLSDAHALIEEREAALRQSTEALAAAQAASGTRDTATSQHAARCDELELRLAEREAAVTLLEQHLGELQAANVRVREEAAATTLRLESQLRELQRTSAGAANGVAAYGPGLTRLAVLSTAEPTSSSSAAGGKRPPIPGAADVDTAAAFKYLAPPTSRERYHFLQDAVQSAHRVTAQARTHKYRVVLGAVAAGVLLLMLLSGAATASTVHARDEVSILRMGVSRLHRDLDNCMSELSRLRDRDPRGHW